MIEGRFGDTTGRPHVECKVQLPRLNRTVNVSFLVDTGADTSLLAPGDLARLNIDHALLGPRHRRIGGIRGHITCATEEALLVFPDGDSIRIYQADLCISFPDDVGETMTSLLGRDILDQWKMTYDPTNAFLGFEVREADWTFPAPQGGLRAK